MASFRDLELDWSMLRTGENWTDEGTLIFNILLILVLLKPILTDLKFGCLPDFSVLTCSTELIRCLLFFVKKKKWFLEILITVQHIGKNGMVLFNSSIHFIYNCSFTRLFT